MKKLMIATAAMAIVGSASAVTVYDYRATVKHPYLKEVKVLNAAGTAKITVYAKYIKSSTIKGYLIQDEEAVLNGGIKAAGAVGQAWITGPNTVAQPENRCFLVAINSGAGKYAYPRIIPGIIEAKWYNPACKAFAKNGQTVPAQGYLWLGGEVVAPDAARLSVGGAGVADALGTYMVVGHKNATIAYPAALIASPGAGAANTLPVAINSTFAAEVWNYAFTSEYLFGQFNQKAGTTLAYADTWLNGAGFGTAGAYDDRDACCGWGTGSAGVGVASLQGNLKGGIYICTENGDDKNHNHPFGGLNAAGTLTPKNDFAPSQFERQLWGTIDYIAVGAAPQTGIFLAGSAARYDDLWVDGPLSLRTTDCVSGTWSIRRVTKDMTAALDTAAGGQEGVFNTVATLTAWCNTVANPPAAFNLPSTDRAGSPADSFDGTLELLETIKGCMKALNKNAKMVGATDGAAAPDKSKVPEALFGPTFYNSYLAQ